MTLQTIDNDVYPIKQTFGANTAAVCGAKFFENVVRTNFGRLVHKPSRRPNT